MHFPLHPETPPEGMVLADYFSGRGFDFEAASARLRQLMADEGLPYDRGERSYNSRLAQELAAWAVEEHGREEIHNRLFKAYFVEQRNISAVEELGRGRRGGGPRRRRSTASRRGADPSFPGGRRLAALPPARGHRRAHLRHRRQGRGGSPTLRGPRRAGEAVRSFQAILRPPTGRDLRRPTRRRAVPSLRSVPLSRESTGSPRSTGGPAADRRGPSSPGVPGASSGGRPLHPRTAAGARTW